MKTLLICVLVVVCGLAATHVFHDRVVAVDARGVPLSARKFDLGLPTMTEKLLWASNAENFESLEEQQAELSRLYELIAERDAVRDPQTPRNAAGNLQMWRVSATGKPELIEDAYWTIGCK